MVPARGGQPEFSCRRRRRRRHAGVSRGCSARPASCPRSERCRRHRRRRARAPECCRSRRQLLFSSAGSSSALGSSSSPRRCHAGGAGGHAAHACTPAPPAADIWPALPASSQRSHRFDGIGRARREAGCYAGTSSSSARRACCWGGESWAARAAAAAAAAAVEGRIACSGHAIAAGRGRRCGPLCRRLWAAEWAEWAQPRATARHRSAMEWLQRAWRRRCMSCSRSMMGERRSISRVRR